MTTPLTLAAAIDKASAKFSLPPALLTSIWQRETGSTYPNPWANGLGYGGEFGTRMTAPFGPASVTKRIVEPPLQTQADYAAGTIASLIVSAGGDTSKALLSYSGGGYSSLPGVPARVIPNAGAVATFRATQSNIPYTGGISKDSPAGQAVIDTKNAATGWIGDLETWLTSTGKLVLAYVLLVGVAGALLVTGLKGLGVPVPKMPTVAPVPV